MNNTLPNPELDTIPTEFLDVGKVIKMGAKKHGMNSWLEPGVFTFEKRTSSEFRHLMKKTGLWNSDNLIVEHAIDVILNALKEQPFLVANRFDEESGLPHELHSACNALMFYTLIERGIIREET